MSGDFLEIQDGSVQMMSYDGSAPNKAGPDLTRFDHFETTLKHVKINSMSSAFNMSRLSLHLGNGLKIEHGKVNFSSDTINKTRLQVDLKNNLFTYRYESGGE